jgi:hypothetical protein
MHISESAWFDEYSSASDMDGDDGDAGLDSDMASLSAWGTQRIM